MGALTILWELISGGFTKILPFLLKYWKEVLIAALVAGFLWYNHERTVTIENLQAQVVKLQKANEDCKAAIDTRNTEIDAQKKKSDEEIKKTQEQAAAIIAQKKKENDNLLKKLKEKPLATTCTGAIDELRQAPKGDLKWQK